LLHAFSTQEDIITKLFEFLEKPHVTGDVTGDTTVSEKEKVMWCWESFVCFNNYCASYIL